MVYARTSHNRIVNARKLLTQQFQKPYGLQPAGLEDNFPIKNAFLPDFNSRALARTSPFLNQKFINFQKKIVKSIDAL